MADSGDASAGKEIGKEEGKGNSSAAAWVEDLQRTVKESTDSAIRSARSLQQNSSTQFRSFQDFVPYAASQYAIYENAFVNKIKGGLMEARENPAASIGIGVAAGLLLLRGPRRFLFRQTLGRFQSEEAQLTRAEKNVESFKISVGLMKKESQKLLERAASAESEMKEGLHDLKLAGDQVKRLAKTVRKVEAHTADLMDELRELPGRDALKLRADVAALASTLKEKRISLDKRIMKISDLGIPI